MCRLHLLENITRSVLVLDWSLPKRRRCLFRPKAMRARPVSIPKTRQPHGKPSLIMSMPKAVRLSSSYGTRVWSHTKASNLMVKRLFQRLTFMWACAQHYVILITKRFALSLRPRVQPRLRKCSKSSLTLGLRPKTPKKQVLMA